MKNTITTKYFSGTVELKGAYPVRRDQIRAQFPTGMIQRFDDFNLLVGTRDGKYSAINFLPVTRIVRFKVEGSNHKCDGRCQNATRGDCECSCKGQFHGVAN